MTMITTECLKLGKSLSVPWVVHPGVGQEHFQAAEVRCTKVQLELSGCSVVQ